jgi:hypothetical protein
MNRISLTHVLASVSVLASLSLLTSKEAAAQACNPYQVNFKINRPPNNRVPLPLDFIIQSSCNIRSALPLRPHCGFETTVDVSVATSATQKCSLLVQNIQASCGLPGVGFSVVDNCAADQSFTVSDPFCTDTNGGMMVGISNFPSLLRPNNLGGFVFGDYEFDTVTPGCGSASGYTAILGGSATGAPILSGETQGNVVAAVDLSARGGGVAEVTHATHLGETPEQIVAALVPNLNISLTGSNVACAAAPGSGRVLQCNDLPTGSGMLAPLVSRPPIALILQSDDTGVQKGLVSGPATDVQRVVTLVDDPNAPTFVNIPPPPPPNQIPAAGGAAVVGLAMLLAVIGLWTVGRRANVTGGARRAPGGGPAGA